MTTDSHVENVARLYDSLALNGPYGTLAPDNLGGRKSRYISAVFDEALLPILQDRAGADEVLLDYGCGTGIFSIKAAKYVGKVLGVDVSPSMLEWGRRLDSMNQSIDWILADGVTIPLPDASCNWVVARESLCYVPAPALPDVLTEIHRVLKPGGCFLWLEQVSDNPAFRVHPDAPLLEKRSAKQLIEAAERSGLILESSTCVREPRFPWIYLIWAGLVPERMTKVLARWEVKYNRKHGKIASRRWKDALLEFTKPD
ncbi:class I SAM-dependent methyltransferase [Luteimonas sp. MC1895]|uniref:methyltransferase domain-containing protein n=1 Tax=Luteimonas sp. MC1895 TaxID=2819513 RepID=UPI0018F07F0C|nr:methyltransferase domain-containing protein [Luteimonas sp. MC1895]